MYDFIAVQLRRILAVNIVCLIVWILIVDISSVTGYNASVCTAYCSDPDTEHAHWYDTEYCGGSHFCCKARTIGFSKSCCSFDFRKLGPSDNQPSTIAKSDCKKPYNNSRYTPIIVGAVVGGLLIVCLIGGFVFWIVKRHQAMNQVNGPASSTVVYGGAAAHNAYSGPQNNAPYPPAGAPPPPTNYYGGPPNNAPYPPAGAPPPANYYGAPPPSYDSKY
ncbi:uncharacterized protein LOC141907116 [Tubulanus polymorphus]|uniref:uncharacterized protein LOC141907116 n=1 Tax=Tubulanus polymorphus TaxID=672921 RepID=UPI003DA544A0